MTVHTAVKRARAPKGRIAAALAYDAPISATLLTTFQFFLVSVSFIVGVAPAIAFTLLVGWQMTHLAIWLGAASLVTVVPAVYGVLAASRRQLVVTGELHAGREFWRSFVFAFRSLWWLCIAVPVLVIVLAYDYAVLGGSDIALLTAGAAAIAGALLVIGLCLVAVDSGEIRPWPLLVTTVRAIGRRPHVALSWGLLVAVGIGVTMMPLVGVTAMLFAPSAVGAALVICSTTLGFTRHLQETRS